MAAFRHIKVENVIDEESYTGVITADSFMENNEYYQYEGDTTETVYESESLIEYVEEDDLQSNDYIVNDTVEDTIKTHTLTVKRLVIDEQLQEVYCCIECALDFPTLEDFTKAHKVMQKKRVNQNLVAETNVYLNAGDIESAPIISDFEKVDGVIIKEEVRNNQNVVEVFEADTGEHTELAANITDYADFDNKQFVETTSETDEVHVKEEITYTADEEDEGEKYFCCDCQLVFCDIQTAEQHDCSAVNNATALKTHDISAQDTAAENKDYENNLRLFVAQQNDALGSNKISRKQEKKYQCAECDKKFSTSTSLQTHSRSHNAKPGKVKRRTPDTATEIKNTTCPVCKTTFSSYKNLKLHLKIHDAQQLRTLEQALPAGAKTQYNDMNKFFCEICNKSFEQNLLGIHKNMHQQSTEYNCGICNKHFENKTNYDMHMQMHADKPPKPRKQQTKNTFEGKGFPCQYCGRTFQRPFEKVRHERIHTGEKPHACEVCGKTFRVSYSLTLHLRTHTDIRPYACATCNKRFKSQPVYAHHLRTHEAERSYKCEVCSKTFRTSVQLSAHRNIHSKPYNCPVCNRPFASLYSVKIHMKTHNKLNRANDVTKYSCYVCGAEYARVSALRMHMRDLHLIDFDTNQSIQLDDDVITPDDQSSHSQHNMGDSEEDQEVDHEAAVLIAAAAEADCGTYIEDATGQISEAASPGTSRMDLQVSQSYEVTMENDELIVDNYQTEEIVSDWLTK
ncbi:zinc finger and SCAN domain-containing protein 2 [Ceratitis capitata]|uniref:Zinc finger and SCAN domain-containing protein 2 n=1 Tax=Ceratitis capitata TaxID=7213 RepID=W8BPK5_CERCA|nr:zinc finger and SCAN domain-containing protein 2 [Ceratitis capitata]